MIAGVVYSVNQTHRLRNESHSTLNRLPSYNLSIAGLSSILILSIIKSSLRFSIFIYCFLNTKFVSLDLNSPAWPITRILNLK